MKTVCPMPCNIYGTGDHFNLDNAHVLSSLVRRFCDAAESGEETVTCWGTGITRREFIHVDDVVRAMLFLMETKDDSDPINVGTGADISIADLAAKIASASGFRGKTLWDPSKPDGMPKKCVDVSRLRNLGFVAEVGLDEGISRTTEEYLSLKKAGEIK
jgi:GDP-L-fucose synthase